jgi:hypothetical protein
LPPDFHHTETKSQIAFAPTSNRIELVLNHRKLKFSDTFYQQHRSHLIRVGKRAGLFFSVSGGLTALFLFVYQNGKVSVFEVYLSAAVFLCVVIGIALGLPSSFRVRLLPYFQETIDNAVALSGGKSLLENSRKLDELAIAMGTTPFSEFASGDDLIAGEKLIWFDPEPALITTEKLLESKAAKDFDAELVSDLTSLKSVLESAVSKRTRFCLLVREGSTPDAAEMDRRKGSFV